MKYKLTTETETIETEVLSDIHTAMLVLLKPYWGTVERTNTFVNDVLHMFFCNPNVKLSGLTYQPKYAFTLEHIHDAN